MLVNVPNILTTIRVFFAPVIFFLILSRSFGLAFFCFILASITDWADGFLARQRKEETYFGQIFDPIADKIFIFFSYMALFLVGIIPGWLFFSVFLRDFLILAGSVMLKISGSAFSFRPLLISKINTALQLILCLVVMQPFFKVNNLLLYIIIGVVLWLTLLSGLIYARIFFKNYKK